MEPALSQSASRRLVGIDVLRGAVMVAMALDHARDYFGDIRLDPTDVETTTPALFLTRWLTHFCAPVFVFLAGTSAWLWADRRGTRDGLSRYLVTRGLWLILLEATVVNFTWILTFSLGIWFFQVIAAIGVAMIALAALVRLPDWAVLAFGVLVCAGHPLLAGVGPAESWDVWALFYGGQTVIVPFEGVRVWVVYSSLPWIGVMALGFGMGALFRRPALERGRWLLGVGGSLIAAFVALRLASVGGEPRPWGGQDSVAMNAVSFLNCTKYPPSPLFLCMTLGPALVVLALIDGRDGPVARVLATYGRVPLFYYVLHVLLIHLAARTWNAAVHGSFLSPMQAALTGSFPPWFGGSLGAVYLGWILVVAALYAPCAWFARVRRRRRWKILAYL